MLLVAASVVVAVAIIGVVAVTRLLPGADPGGSSTTGTTSAASPAPGSSAGVAEFAPYVDLSVESRPTLTQLAQDAKVSALTVGFAISRSSSSCAVVWDDSSALSARAAEIKQAAAAGVKIIVSIGGANGADLAQSCASAQATEAQLQKILDLGVRYLDFDIETPARTSDATANAARAEAIVALQKKYSDLKVSFTLGAAVPTSATADKGVDHTEPWLAAVDAGASVDRVNVMTMDYGGSVAPGNMAGVAIAAATSLHSQIVAAEGLSSAAAWAAVGITPMIGVNDNTDEVFSLADAQRVVAFAEQNSIGMLSYWSLLRDKQCSADVTTQPVETCSGVTQSGYAFASLFSAALV